MRQSPFTAPELSTGPVTKSELGAMGSLRNPITDGSTRPNLKGAPFSKLSCTTAQVSKLSLRVAASELITPPSRRSRRSSAAVIHSPAIPVSPPRDVCARASPPPWDAARARTQRAALPQRCYDAAGISSSCVMIIGGHCATDAINSCTHPWMVAAKVRSSHSKPRRGCDCP